MRDACDRQSISGEREKHDSVAKYSYSIKHIPSMAIGISCRVTMEAEGGVHVIRPHAN